MVEATKEGRVRWYEDPTTSGFFVAFDNFSLVLSERRDRDDFQDFVAVGIRNKEGKLADSFEVWANENDYETVQTLYAFARRSARRIDEAIAEITKELQSRGQIGAEVEPELPPPGDAVPF
jgi:hypothetical protein